MCIKSDGTIAKVRIKNLPFKKIITNKTIGTAFQFFCGLFTF